MADLHTENIKDLISSKGSITFAEFMETALYHPRFGYYNSAEKPKIGADGDFYTSSDVHPFIGKVLAHEFKTMFEILGTNSFSIVEMGAGKGTMALDILNEINKYDPDFYDIISYIIIEKSYAFRSRQQELLKDCRQKVKWINSLTELKDAGGFTGSFFSNELVDSFPFNRVYQDGTEFKEIYVSLNNDLLVEKTGKLSTGALLEYFKRLNISLPDGMKTEVNLEALSWVKDVSLATNKGFIITIDYGYPAHLYYAPARMNGTFMCYFNHSVNEEPFERVGRQDITAHIDFTSIAIEGKRVGLELSTFTSLPFYLMDKGKDILEEEISKLQDIDSVNAFKSSSAIKNLIHPEGMGGKFKVMIQTKGIDVEYPFNSHFNRKKLLEI